MIPGALYARVSTARQENERTIESQLEALRRRASESGWDMPEERVYLDDGWSGTRLDRPGLDALRDAAAEGRFTHLLIFDPDRLARSFVHQQVLLEELVKRGVQIVFLERPVSEKPEDQLLVQMQGVFAEYERAKIRERTRRGRLHRARTHGTLNWPIAPYGYRIVVGADKVRRAEINEDEAAWVRQAYGWVLDHGMSARKVAKRFNDIGLPPRKARIWNASSAYGLLTHSVYSGTAHYNRREAVEPKRPIRPGKYRRSVRSGRKLRPPEHWIPIPVPAIVTSEQQALVRKQLQANRLHCVRRTQYEYLLRRLVVCGKCGWRMSALSVGSRRGVRYPYYTCRTREAVDTGRPEGRCRAKHVRSDHLDAAVWEALRGWIRNPQVLHVELEALHSGSADEWDPEGKELERVTTTKKGWERQIQRLVDAYQAGVIELSELQERRGDLGTRVMAAQDRLEELEALRRQHVKSEDVMADLERFAAVLRQGLDALTFADSQQLVRLLVERIVVEDGEVTIEHVVPLKGRFCDLRSEVRPLPPV